MSRDLGGGANYMTCGDLVKLRGSGAAVGTLAAWVYPDAVAAATAWFHTYNSQWGWGLNGVNLRFTKYAVVDLPSSRAFAAGEWQFAAIVNSASNVRYFRMTAAGVISAQNIGNGSALGATANDCRIGTLSGTAERMDGALAHLGVWIGQFLSDNELVSFARGVFPRQPTFYAPLYGVAFPEADLSPSPATLTQVGTAAQRAHPPLGPYLLAA